MADFKDVMHADSNAVQAQENIMKAMDKAVDPGTAVLVAAHAICLSLTALEMRIDYLMSKAS